MNSIELIQACRMVAIIRLDDLSQAVELSSALLRGGITVQEYTLTNRDALSTVSQLIAAIPEFSSGVATIGVGSVRRIEQVDQAHEAGAHFIVTPTFNSHVIARCTHFDLPVISGAYTPTEIANAWDAGSSLVKVFPARNLGPNYVKDVLAPMPDLKLMPTGGIDCSNMQHYFDAGAVAVGVGGNLINQRLIEHRNWAQISETARKYACLAAMRADDA